MSVPATLAAAWTPDQAADPAAVSRALRARGVALDPDEVVRLGELLGRPPRWPEAVLFGILWSEHCSYKSTRHLLRRLPTRSPNVVLGPGEDAGVVRLPAPCEDTVLVVGHESHNHPSQVLPVEGAATGVGGIVRDVVCMGAEVVGCLDALRFGDPRGDVHVRDVVRGVVDGVAMYADALGVPNLGGDTRFDGAFDGNVLVNAMAVGLAPADGVVRSRVPDGDGPWVFVLVGKPTDESGFGGAAFASDALGGEDTRGAVQLPDPFLKRVLNVATAEVLRVVRARGIPCGFKDLGAGGIACATSELAAAGGCGAVIELERAHRVGRELAPEILLCAETQERYCWVVPQGFADELCAIYEQAYALGEAHPGAGARRIGRAIGPRRFHVTWNGETLVDCAVDAITEGRRVERPAAPRPRPVPGRSRRRAVDPQLALMRMLKGPELGSREYLYRHYDSEVQGRTWLRPGEGDAPTIRVHPERPTGLAFAVGGHPRWCEADPELGARHAVAEAARKVAVVGGRPWCLTDCLNFGSPEDPAVMADLERSVDGLAAAAAALGGLAAPGAPLPFVSGNVSLYNQGPASAIPPSPIVMACGVVRDVTRLLGLGWRRAGDVLVLVGEPRAGLDGTLYRRELLGEWSPPPPLELEREARLQEFAVAVVEDRAAVAAHAIGDAGVAGALVEMLLASPPDLTLGADVDLGALEGGPLELLFSERPGILYATTFDRLPRLSQLARGLGVGAWPIGALVAGAPLRVRLPGAREVGWSRAELASASQRALARLWNEERL